MYHLHFCHLRNGESQLECRADWPPDNQLGFTQAAMVIIKTAKCWILKPFKLFEDSFLPPIPKAHLNGECSGTPSNPEMAVFWLNWVINQPAIETSNLFQNHFIYNMGFGETYSKEGGLLEEVTPWQAFYLVSWSVLDKCCETGLLQPS